MESLTLETPIVESVEQGTCHVLCVKCGNDKITLCGAYKSVLCNITYLVSLQYLGTICSACKKPLCPDCEELAFSPCVRCGT